MKVEDTYSQFRVGRITINRRGMFKVTSISVRMPFKKKLILYKHRSNRNRV